MPRTDDEDRFERPRVGRDKDVAAKERAERQSRRLPGVEEGALVLRSSRGHAWLENEDGTERHVHLPRWAQVVPGDRVRVDGAGRVDGQVPRRTVLRRNAGVKGEQILAANLDQVVVVVGPALLLREGFLGRALCGALAEGLDPVLVFNKADLDEDGEMRERASVYGATGFRVLVTSAKSREGLDALRATLVGRTSALLGQSGVGKSSLVNAMFPGQDMRVGEVDAWGRGKHTTTLGRAIRLEPGTILIDLPGVREFGLVELDPRVLARAFPDIAAIGKDCRFDDCPHDGEVEGCAVVEAVDAEKLDPKRWEAYVAVEASWKSGTEGGGRI